MSEMRLKQESLAERCEICHQSDLFDRVKSTCSRCDFINNQIIQDIKQKNKDLSLTNFETICIFWLFLGIPLCVSKTMIIFMNNTFLNEEVLGINKGLVIGLPILITLIVVRETLKNNRIREYLKFLFGKTDKK